MLCIFLAYLTTQVQFGIFILTFRFYRDSSTAQTELGTGHGTGWKEKEGKCLHCLSIYCQPYFFRFLHFHPYWSTLAKRLLRKYENQMLTRMQTLRSSNLPWERAVLPLPDPLRQHHSHCIQASKLKYGTKGGGRKESKSRVGSRSQTLVEEEERRGAGDGRPLPLPQSSSCEHTHWPQQESAVRGHRWVPAPLAGCSLSASPNEDFHCCLLFLLASCHGKHLQVAWPDFDT